jgi:hypothetical protein
MPKLLALSVNGWHTPNETAMSRGFSRSLVPCFR